MAFMQAKEWLDNLDLLTMEQIDNIVEDGYDSLQRLKLLTDEALLDYGVEKKGHRLSILTEIQEIEGSASNPGNSMMIIIHPFIC